MKLGEGESGIVELHGNVVTKTTHRAWNKSALKNMALALKKAPKGLGPKLLSYNNQELKYEYVKGEQPKKLNRKQLALHAKQLAKLHEKKYELLGPLTDPKKERFSLYKALISEWRSYCKEPFAKEYREYYDKLKKLLKYRNNFFVTRKSSFVHSDCSLTNMIVKGNTIKYIDWELSGYEDPVKDVIGFYRHFQMLPWAMTLSEDDEKFFLNTYKRLSGDVTIIQRAKFMHLYHAFIDALYFEWKIKHYDTEQTKVLSKKGYEKARDNCKKYLEKQLNKKPETSKQRKNRLLKKARTVAKKIYKEVPCISIYLKGSIVRDEVIYNSDADLVVITKTNKYFDTLKEYEDGEIQVARYTLKELRTGIANMKNRHTPPKATNYDFRFFKQLIGEKIDASNFPKTHPQKRYEFMPKLVTQVIQGYREYKFGFGDIIKQTLWLARIELHIKKGLNYYKWKDVIQHYPKNHIYQQAYKYRLHPPAKRGKRCEAFITKVERYMEEV